MTMIYRSLLTLNLAPQKIEKRWSRDSMKSKMLSTKPSLRTRRRKIDPLSLPFLLRRHPPQSEHNLGQSGNEKCEERCLPVVSIYFIEVWLVMVGLSSHMVIPSWTPISQTLAYFSWVLSCTYEDRGNVNWYCIFSSAMFIAHYHWFY